MRLVDKFERTIAEGFGVVAAISCFFLAISTVALWQVKSLFVDGTDKA
jgi:hypothetical protein